MKPYLVIGCACGKGMSFELGYGKRIQYTGMKSARILADLFRHFHTGEHCAVVEATRESETATFTMADLLPERETAAAR